MHADGFGPGVVVRFVPASEWLTWRELPLCWLNVLMSLDICDQPGFVDLCYPDMNRWIQVCNFGRGDRFWTGYVLLVFQFSLILASCHPHNLSVDRIVSAICPPLVVISLYSLRLSSLTP